LAIREIATGQCSLQDVFVAGFEEYAAGRQLHPRELNAARCISHCYTPALGMHLQYCEQGDYEHLQYHACRHRSCPKCGAYSRPSWIDSQLRQLLPCAHFHVIFTIPHSLLQLWEFNRRWFIGALFDCARLSLLELTADRRHLGATPGLLMSLHTWGRDLARHPHLHCLVSAGGVDATGQWKACRPGQLVPFKPLHNLFRGKLLARLRQALDDKRLNLPAWLSEGDCRTQLRRLYARQWNVRIEPQYEHGRGLALYLARYAKGGPIPQDRELRMDGDVVQMPYTDHRDHKTKLLQLKRGEFIERILWHAPPRGVHTVRQAGLYSSPHRKHHAAALAALTASAPNAAWPRPTKPTEPTPASAACPSCGRPLLRLLLARPQLRRDFAQACQRGNSIRRTSTDAMSTGPPPQPRRAGSNQHASRITRCPTSRSSRHPTVGH
jgi:hypothetical protein